jgi:PiT family inorganic phosphate transporter
MGSAVANTISKIINFSYDPNHIITPALILVTLGAAQFSIVVWATAAQRFGIPTSESHALVASLTGAAFAMTNSFSSISLEAWTSVLIGLAASTFIGFFGGFFVVKLVIFLFKGVSRKKSNIAFSYAQMFSAAMMAFTHGAQDGQKFMGVFVLALVLGTQGMNLPVWLTGSIENNVMVLPFWVMLLCSAIMAVGTSIGGYKIIKKMGMEMVKLEKYQGFSAEIAASVCMLGMTWWGKPVSTTHTKATAIMGVGAVNGVKSVNWKIVNEMVMAWLLTFPVCALIGYLMTKLSMLFIK